MNKTVFISSSIPYVNARPHIGHALEFVQADVYARYRKLAGDRVFFTTGTDDNALKNVLKAEEVHEEVNAYVRRNAASFKEVCDILNIGYDYFIETSNDEKHTSGAQKLWRAAQASGDIYTKEYSGLYCVGCEEFKTEKDVNEQNECPEHTGKQLENIKEVNYFFRLSKYQAKLQQVLETGELAVLPQSRKNEILAFIASGLEDFSVSRSVARARGWGVPVPDDDSQVMYVWFDALSNYINALGYAEDDTQYHAYWEEADERIHFVGKGINRFHTVYWPAMLLSAGVRLPSTVFVHGYFTVDGKKMSKSVGNVVDPADVVSEYGTDAVRYYFARHQHPYEDGDFTMEGFHESYNGNLANGIGNFTARVMKMATTHLSGPVVLTEEDKTFEQPVGGAIEHFEFNKAMDLIFEHVGKGDRYIQENEPYKAIKHEETKEKALADIEKLVHHLYKVAVHLEPFMPETARKIRTAVEKNEMPETLFIRK